MFFRTPCDVTAVILTTGEPTTQQAIDSVRQQTIPVGEIVVRDMRPFYRALNEGAKQVATPFFVQVDADMILDRNCVATLRKAMTADIGISVGRLRDALVHQVVGIKMFRTACFEIAEFRDSISPDTDFVEDIERAGWRTVYVGQRARRAKEPWKTLGEHRPDYAPAYTYKKYLMEGRRYRHRGSAGGLRAHFGNLERSQHPSAFVAQVALARGFFREFHRDALGREDGNDEFELLQHFLLEARQPNQSDSADLESNQMSLADRFHSYFQIGRAAFEANDPETFRQHMVHLNAKSENATGWPCKLALCHGLLARGDEASRADLAAISDFLSSQNLVQPRSPQPAFLVSARRGPQIDEVMTYAATAGLTQFVMAPPAGERHGLSINPAKSESNTTDVVSTVDAKGRPRIQLPFRMFGHVVCTDPDRSTGLFWCYDLLKAGYLTAHIPSPLGARRTLVPTLIARNALRRVGWSWGTPRTAALSAMAKQRKLTYQPDVGVILMVAENLARGGSERQMLTLSHGLLRKGYRVQVFSLNRLEPGIPSFEGDFKRLGITATYASDSPAQLARISATLSPDSTDYAALPRDIGNRIAAVKSAIERYRPEVVHAWLDGPGVVGALAACMAGTPRCVIQQGSISIARRRLGSADLFRLGHRTLARNRAVKVVNNSVAGARDNEHWIGLRSGRIGVLYNGFDPASARAAEPTQVHRLRQSLGIPEQAQIVGTVMRFVPEKDPALWIDTAAAIAKLRPGVHFLIAGFGPLEDTIKARIEALGLRDRVALAGPVEDAGLIYCSTDVVLLTSAVEGIPNVMIEAQALGRPVVAPDVGGTCEAVAEGRTGTIVRPRAAEHLANATIGLLDNVAWRERVRDEGPEFVATRFGIDRMVSETLAFYDIGR